MPIDASALDDLTGLLDASGPPPAAVVPPVPAAPAAPSAPPPEVHAIAATPAGHKGIDWQALLKLTLPILGELSATGAHGHFLTGYSAGQQLADEERRQKALDAQRLGAQKADYVLKIAEHAQGLEDPTDFANLVHLAQHAGEKAGYLQPGELTDQLTFSPTKRAAKQLKELTDQLDALERQGYNLDQLAQAGSTIELKDGRRVPVAAALDVTRKRPLTASGQAIARPEAAGKTEEERFIAKWAKEHGTTVDTLTSDQELEARKAFREAGRTAPTDRYNEHFSTLVQLWQDGHPGQTMPARVKSQLQVTAARDLERPPAAGQGGPGQPGGLSDEGVEYAATQYRVTGHMPPLGMGSSGARTAIVNRAAEQAKTLGQTPAQSIQKQAAYKADATSLTQMRKLSSAAEAFETKAVQQADIIRELSTRVDRTKYPIINRVLQAGRTEITGDADATKLANAIQTFAAEYAKIIEGSTASAGGSTDSARRTAGRLINAAMNKRTMGGVLDLMQREMRLTIDGYGATIDHITDRMGGPPAPPSVTPPPASGGRGGGPSYQDYLQSRSRGSGD